MTEEVMTTEQMGEVIDQAKEHIAKQDAEIGRLLGIIRTVRDMLFSADEEKEETREHQ